MVWAPGGPDAKVPALRPISPRPPKNADTIRAHSFVRGPILGPLFLEPVFADSELATLDPGQQSRRRAASPGGVTSMPPIRVLCVDDHRLMREGIVHIVGLQPDIKVVAEASNGEEAVEQFLRHQPDVTLMDLQLPRMNGLQAIRAIRHGAPDARVVVLTMYHGDEDIYRALQAGAAGYLLKDTVPEDLVRVIREVHAGKRAIPPDVEAALALRATQPALTFREIQVLELLATGKRNKEIAADLGISSDTARAHIKSIFIKFNVHDRTAALAEALRRGMIHIG